MSNFSKYKFTAQPVEVISDIAPKAFQASELADIFRDQYKRDNHNINFQEVFYVAGLNNANEVIGITLIAIGGVNCVVVDPKIVMKSALDMMAPRIALCHNHPSNRLVPSRPDINITNKLNEACKFMDIDLLEHIILSEDSFYAFTEDGKL